MFINTFAKRTLQLIETWLEHTAARVNRPEIIKDIYAQVEISSGYFAYLTIANLIALCGLLLNNSSVIIGAMLISPLMGPILSSGFAFITGNISIGKKGLKKLILSLAVTIVFAAIATYISPLKVATQEILSRTHPNIYDLFIAFFAGSAGAMSICTRKSYVIVVTGVAIATAVIPPLSVTGYGVGSGQFAIAAGGFFLFFTNFVAIVISTCIVFFIYGFRPVKEAYGDEKMSARKRFGILGVTFVVIAIPLIYTLHRSLTEINLRRAVQYGLEKVFNVENKSHLATFTYKTLSSGITEIEAIVNTNAYMKETEVEKATKDIGASMSTPIRLNVEQVLVQKGGLKEQALSPSAIQPAIKQKTFDEQNKEALDSLKDATVRISAKINSIIYPSTIKRLHFGYDDKSATTQVLLTIRKDDPLTQTEKLWLQSIISETIMSRADLKVDNAPLIDPIYFNEDQSDLPPVFTRPLSVLKDVFEKFPDTRVTVEIVAGDTEKNTTALNRERGAFIVKTLSGAYNVPAKKLKVVYPARRAPRATMQIRVVSNKKT